MLFGFNDSYFVIGDIAPQISSTITARKNRNCEIAGVKQIRIHDFRHSCAFLLIYKGANIITVSKFLGHTKIEETLNTYTHLYKNALTDITALIDDMNNEQKQTPRSSKFYGLFHLFAVKWFCVITGIMI